MTQQQLSDFLTTRGWGITAAVRFYNHTLLDRKAPMAEWRHSLVGAFCARHTGVGALVHLQRFLGKIPTWKDLTKPNIADFRDYLLRQVARNSASAYLHQLMALMGVYEELVPAANFRTAMQLRGEPSQHVALTEDEVELIHRYIPRSAVEADIKRSFMLECMCGARSCDIATLSPDNIRGGWLTYVSQKTKTETSVPVHKHLMEYLLTPVHKAQYFRSVVNTTIKRICRNCGITSQVKLFTHGKWVTKPKCELVGSHTARRSFATQLAMRNVPVPTISKLMGHSDVKMTSKYICLDSRNIGDEAMAFFN